MSFAVSVEPDTYELTASNIIGKIYVQANDEVYPDNGWTDFGVTIIGWWMNAITELLDESASKVSCEFMDGPFRFDVEVMKNNDWRVSFVEERAEREEYKWQGILKAHEVTDGIIAAARTLLEMCRSRGLDSQASYLESRYNKLELARSSLLQPSH